MVPYRSNFADGTPGFGGLLRAEWTKFRSVPRWVLTLLAAVVLTVLIALITANGSERAVAGGGEDPADSGASADFRIRDGGHFLYQPLPGDGELVARVTELTGTQDWAKAGLMIRAGDEAGGTYAALVATPGHGVRLQTGFTQVAGERAEAAVPRWLRLTREGRTVTGYESADGENWSRVGSVDLTGLPATAQAGLFVASPDEVHVDRQFGGESISQEPTEAEATFDGVTLRPESGAAAGEWQDRARSLAAGGSATRLGPDAFTLRGAGDIGLDPGFADDSARNLLEGALAGLVAVVALAVLFLGSEYRRGMIRLTFAATPGRGRVLAAKATVLGAVAGAAGAVAAAAAVLLAGPMLDGAGRVSLTEGPVLRAVLGTGLLLGLVAVLALGVTALVRHSAAAIALVLLPLLVPRLLAGGLPLNAAEWLQRLTPAAGFAIQQTVRRYDTAIGPWAGLAVLAGYTAVVLAAAYARMRRRDA
ncbi:ABC transporter permease [Streptomyces hoynatensis]|uniref:ABC transporter permease n=1 Tax=Streptomyces hoynatensis TaxID=1141874 RepID=A0A3A9Z7G4_9ACTN|nr:ABC transporter permease [Streptomyces hoynatensis]